MRHDPIEGQFQVIGEKPPYEPAIASWPRLLWFVGLFVLACTLNTLKVMSETRDDLRDGSGDTWSAAAEQTPATGTAEHLTQ